VRLEGLKSKDQKADRGRGSCEGESAPSPQLQCLRSAVSSPVRSGGRAPATERFSRILEASGGLL